MNLGILYIKLLTYKTSHKMWFAQSRLPLSQKFLGLWAKFDPELPYVFYEVACQGITFSQNLRSKDKQNSAFWECFNL